MRSCRRVCTDSCERARDGRCSDGWHGDDTVNTTGLVHLLVRTVAKSGNLEINFGPAGDGRLPTAMVQPLLGTGRWLETNGEAICARTTPTFQMHRLRSRCLRHRQHDRLSVWSQRVGVQR